MVKIQDSSHLKVNEDFKLKGKLGEVRGFYRDILFVLVTGELKETNGIYAVGVKDVVNAGQEFVKSVQPVNHQGYCLGNQDRKQKDRKLSRSYVVVKQGEHKGLKGRVMFADDNIVKVEIVAKNLKVDVPRTSVQELRDPTAPISGTTLGVEPMSFDEAQRLNMVDDLQANARMSLDAKADLYGCFGGDTPKGEG